MTAFAYVKSAVIPAAMLMLPAKMDTPEARSMLLAIGLQESGFLHRRQIAGPARGWFQFELGASQNAGVRGVLNHIATRPLIEGVLHEMQYGITAEISYAAIEQNDILAAVYARLLLWTDPKPLPKKGDAEASWNSYLFCWRPGAARPADWPKNFEQAWA